MNSRATSPKPKAKPRTALGQLRQDSRLRSRDFPATDGSGKAVCKRCGYVMVEPMSPRGEFNHYASALKPRAFACPNNNRVLHMDDSELVPFMRKSRRRYLKRMKIRP